MKHFVIMQLSTRGVRRLCGEWEANSADAAVAEFLTKNPKYKNKGIVYALDKSLM